MLANLAVEPLDMNLTELAHQLGWTYTRYADDLTFSRTDDLRRSDAMHLVNLVEHALRAFGLAVRHSKTKSLHPEQGS